jgi:hypothetical protein
MTANDSKYPWFLLDMAAFILVNAVLLWWAGGRISALAGISVFHALLLGLAAYRGAQIISNEIVSEPLRAPFVNKVERDGKEVERPKRRGWKGAMGELIYCPSCSGVWAATVLVYLYIFVPYISLVIALVLSASAMERIITTALNYVKKRTDHV